VARRAPPLNPRNWAANDHEGPRQVAARTGGRPWPRHVTADIERRPHKWILFRRVTGSSPVGGAISPGQRVFRSSPAVSRRLRPARAGGRRPRARRGDGECDVYARGRPRAPRGWIQARGCRECPARCPTGSVVTTAALDWYDLNANCLPASSCSGVTIWLRTSSQRPSPWDVLIWGQRGGWPARRIGARQFVEDGPMNMVCRKRRIGR